MGRHSLVGLVVLTQNTIVLHDSDKQVGELVSRHVVVMGMVRDEWLLCCCVFEVLVEDFEAEEVVVVGEEVQQELEEAYEA